MSRILGVSVISLIPWSLFKNGLKRAGELAYEAGFDGLQILPLRGLNEQTILNISKEFIISYEYAWNCGSFPGMILRKINPGREDKPLIRDFLLFGSCRAVGKRQYTFFLRFDKTSLFVSHDPLRGGALEMNPEAMISVERYANRGEGLVWDTEHVLRRGRHGEPSVASDWQDLLKRTGQNIKLIHVKTKKAPPEMLRALAKKTNCPVILEDFPPFWKSRKGNLDWLKKKKEYLGQFFD